MLWDQVVCLCQKRLVALSVNRIVRPVETSPSPQAPNRNEARI